MSDGIEELERPAWLGALGRCVFCGSEPDVAYDPLNPLAATWRCRACGAGGVVSPPFEAVPIDMSAVEL